VALFGIRWGRSAKAEPKLWGVDDVAAALDVPGDEVERWHRDGGRAPGEPMPPPAMVLNLGRTPVWREADVIAWAVRSGRTRSLWTPPWRRSLPTGPLPDD
jgi:hypothetical protein